MPVDTLAVLRSLDGDDDEDPDDVLDDVSGAHDDVAPGDGGVSLVQLMHMVMTAMVYDG